MVWLLTYIVTGVVVLLTCVSFDDHAPPVGAILMVVALWPLIAVVLVLLALMGLMENICAAVRTIGRERGQ